MRKTYLIGAVVLMVAISASLVMANKPNDLGDGEYHITITPKTLVLSSAGTVVSIHSNIPYSAVVRDTLILTDKNGDDIEITYTKDDACGDLVVKFVREDVKGDPELGTATITLSGEFEDGELFEADDTITVKQ